VDDILISDPTFVGELDSSNSDDSDISDVTDSSDVEVTGDLSQTPPENDEGLAHQFSIDVKGNRDLKPNPNHAPDAWTKNKLRVLDLEVGGAHGLVNISDRCFTKGNSKIAYTDRDPPRMMELEMLLFRRDSNGSLVNVEHDKCSKCRGKKIVEVSSRTGQRVAFSQSLLDVQVKIQCLPSAHGCGEFYLGIYLKAHDAHLLASTLVHVPKVIASRAKK
jgi:hypothetical protein